MEGDDGGEGFTCSGFFRHPHCGSDGKTDSTCDGGELTKYSNCCENGAFYRCDDGNLCVDGNENKGIGIMYLQEYNQMFLPKSK